MTKKDFNELVKIGDDTRILLEPLSEIVNPVIVHLLLKRINEPLQKLIRKLSKEKHK